MDQSTYDAINAKQKYDTAIQDEADGRVAYDKATVLKAAYETLSASKKTLDEANE